MSYLYYDDVPVRVTKLELRDGMFVVHGRADVSELDENAAVRLIDDGGRVVMRRDRIGDPHLVRARGGERLTVVQTVRVVDATP